MIRYEVEGQALKKIYEVSSYEELVWVGSALEM